MKYREPLERSLEARADALSRSFVDSILTDAVLDVLKKQSTAGCLLCSLEELDGEDWD